MADTFPDVIFKRIFLNENVKNSIQISQKFVSRGSNDNKSAYSSGKCSPNLLTHISGTTGRWVKNIMLRGM